MIKNYLKLLYVAFLIPLIILTRFQIQLCYLIPILIPIVAIDSKLEKFIKDWGLFFLVIFFYGMFHGVIDDLNSRVDYDTLPAIERFLFGNEISTIWLQSKMMPLLTSVPGKIMAVFYFGHFFLPIVTLYYFWKNNMRVFQKLIASISILSVFGFVTFLFWPAAPPWMATQNNTIPFLERIILIHLQSISARFPYIYVYFNPNPVAPFPSLHAGYPFLLMLCTWSYSGNFRWFYLINLLIVSVTIVAFGEHYFIDILGGYFYAVISYFIVLLYIPDQTPQKGTG